MFGLDIPLPDFWIAYLSLFWVLVGVTATPPVLRHKGYPFLVGLLAGVVVGVVSGVVFLLLIGVLLIKPTGLFGHAE